MGVLVMKYKFEDLSEAEVILLGRAIGKLLIEEGVALHLKMQGQIIVQENEARAKAEDEAKAKAEEWRNIEREQELSLPKESVT
jgi:hypothetical protein